MANTICSSPKLLQQEEQHLQRVLTRCKYPVWALNRVKIKMKPLAQKNKKKNKSCNTGHQQQNPYIVVPYYKRLSESLKRTCNKYGVEVYFKGGNTIRSLLMAPKDKDPMLEKEWSHLQITSVTGWSVMKNILGNPPEHFKRGSRNIKRSHPPYLTTTPDHWSQNQP